MARASKTTPTYEDMLVFLDSTDGEIARVNFPGNDELFSWVKRNERGLRIAGLAQRKDIVKQIEATGGKIPDTELLVYKKKTQGDYSTAAHTFDTTSEFVRQLFHDVADIGEENDGTFSGSLSGPITKNFVKSLGFVPDGYGDFSVSTFERQSAFFASYANDGHDKNRVSVLCKIYDYIAKQLPEDQKVFTYETGLVPCLFKRRRFYSCWADGFRACIHTPSDPVPSFSKWLLFPNSEELKRTNISPDAVPVDVSYPEPRLQHLLASWLWTECDNASAIRRVSPKMKELFDTFVIDEKTKAIIATNIGVTKWVASLRSTMGTSLLRHHKAWARSLVAYGVKEGILEQQETVPLILGISEKGKRWQPDETQAADKQDLSKLLTEIEKRSADSLLDELFYGILVTIVLTPLRLGNVVSLKLSDFIDGPGNIHAVKTTTKTDGSGKSTIQLPASVHKLLMSIVSRTEPCREKASQNIADYVFLRETTKLRQVKALTTSDFNTYIKGVCNDLEIAPIGSREIRRRYETEVVMQGLERNISRMAIQPLTGHASIATTEKYYVREDIREYLEAAYGIEIGIPEMKGDVVADDDEDIISLADDDTVEGGAGFCRNPQCNVPGMLTCLMCKGFLTAPRCIPEMEEALGNIQQRLKEAATNSHEREHLLAVKRLYVGYLAVMYSKGEDDE